MKFLSIEENLLVDLYLPKFNPDTQFCYHYFSTINKFRYRKADLLYFHNKFLVQTLHRLSISRIMIYIFEFPIA